MKIVMVGPGLKVRGGISTVVNGYLDTWDKAESIRYIPTMKDGSKVYKALVFALAIPRLLLAIPGCDLVHIHVASDASFGRKYLVSRLAKLFNKPTVVHLHGGDFMRFYRESPPRKKARISRFFDEAHQVVGLSKVWIKNIGLITDSPVTIVYNGVNIPKSEFKKKDTCQLLYLGHIVPLKGIYGLVDVVKSLEDKGYKFELIMGGVGESDKLLKKIDDLGVRSIKYVGWTSGLDKEKLLEESSIFVLPSLKEGVPMTMLEAMSYKCCPVMSSAGGITDILTHGETGMIHDPDDLEQFEENLIDMFENRDKMITIGNKAFEHLKANYTIDSSMKALEKIYESCMR